jgi:hypothetical protein
VSEKKNSKIFTRSLHNRRNTIKSSQNTTHNQIKIQNNYYSSSSPHRTESKPKQRQSISIIMSKVHINMPRCHTCITIHLRVRHEISPRVQTQTSHVSLLSAFLLCLKKNTEEKLCSLFLFFFIFFLYNTSFNGIFTQNEDLYVYTR